MKKVRLHNVHEVGGAELAGRKDERREVEHDPRADSVGDEDIVDLTKTIENGTEGGKV